MDKLLLIVLAVGVFVVEVAMIPVGRGRRSDDGGLLEAVVEHLSQQVTSLTAQLNSVNTQLTAQLNSVNTQLTTQLNSVNTDLSALKSRTDSPIAFYAVNSVNPVQAASAHILVLNHAITNVGNAYNTLTGVFTAPVPGLYHFLATFTSNYGTNQLAYGAIYVDSTRMASGLSDDRHGYNDQTTISIIVHLTAGQQVYVRNDSDGVKDFLANYVTDPFTTFSGLLIHGD